MNNERKAEIESQLTDHEPTVKFLCSLPEDRYQIVFPIMKLVKLLEYQKINDEDKNNAESVWEAYSKESTSKLALMSFLYGKIEGKREERKKRG